METKKKYKGRGRPDPNSPFDIIEIHKLSLSATHDSEAIEQNRVLAGWRIYVTNTPADMITLNQSSQYYRDEYLVERGFHRFKKGSIPALPLFIRLPERIKGLMLLLTVALQVLTSIEFVARKELEKAGESISGLVPGNPKMKTNRPTAERLLAQFDNIHLLIQTNGQKIVGAVVESLTPLQKRILSLLKLPEKIYVFEFENHKITNST
jgi:transposase